ncbi:GM20610 [Drosophila sechellia]|uniref:GM20610 n=1 Tax=Drosophila sechellia TaxID=7238 RepID=B4HSR2_DROSE|nr:GM20610 [Drosophila sechellia]
MLLPEPRTRPRTRPELRTSRHDARRTSHEAATRVLRAEPKDELAEQCDGRAMRATN